MNFTNIPSMRFLILGAGAIGTYVGGSLVLAGQPVVFLERPETAGELYRRGMRLCIRSEEQYIHEPAMAGSLDEALAQGPFDVAVLAVKAYDTERILRDLAPYRAALPPVLCLQNGVENEAAIAAALGADKVIPGTVTSAIGRRAAGDVVLERLRGMGVAAGHPLAPALVALLDEAGLRARLFPDAAAMKWSKMLTNLPANAASAILGLPPRAIFDDPRLYAIEIAQLREALRVMAAGRIHVVDLPGTPVRALAALAGGVPAALSRPLMARALGAGRGGKMPSFHIDLHAGRPQSEVGYLNGVVARRGAEWGVPTPVNRALTETLQALVDGRQALDAYAGNVPAYLKLFER